MSDKNRAEFRKSQKATPSSQQAPHKNTYERAKAEFNASRSKFPRHDENKLPSDDSDCEFQNCL